MSSTGAKRRKVDCGYLNCGGDANFGNNVTIANNLTVDGTIEGTAIVPDIKGIADGSAASPSIAFANSTNTGIYRDTTSGGGTPGLAITANGTEKFRVGNSATYSLQDFHADGYTVWTGNVEASGTGYFGDVQSGTAEVSIVTIGSSGKIILPNGTAAGPIVNFSSSPSTGLYSPASNTLGVSCNGTQVLQVSPSAVQCNQPLTVSGNLSAEAFTGYPNSGSTALVQQYYALNGSTALIPAYTFQGDNETGMFQPSTGQVSLCTSGTEQLRVGPSTIEGFVAIQAPNLSGSTPGLIFSSSDNTTGFNEESAGNVSFFGSGTEVLRLGASAIQAFKNITTGSNTIGCGGISSTGDVTLPRYWVRLNRGAVQSIGNTTNTSASWDTVESTGGGSSNWGTITTPLSQVTIPLSGMYYVQYSSTWAQNGSGVRNAYIEINNGGSPGTTRRWAETNISTASAGTSSISSSFIYHFATNDQVSLTVWQNSGGNLNWSNQDSGNTLSTLQICRLSE